MEIGFLRVHYRTFITVSELMTHDIASGLLLLLLSEHYVGVGLGDGLPHGLLGPQPHHLPVPCAGPNQQNGAILYSAKS